MEDDHKTKKDFENFLSRTGLIRQEKICRCFESA